MTENITIAEGNLLTALQRIVAGKRMRHETNKNAEIPKEELKELVNALYAISDVKTALERDMGDLLHSKSTDGPRVITRTRRLTRSM